MTNNKFVLRCDTSDAEFNSFAEWFEVGQHCPKTGSPQATVHYKKGYKGLIDLVRKPDFKPKNIWGYFDYLPLHDPANVVAFGNEGVVPIQRWDFFEKFAKEHYNMNIKVYAHRHDLNQATQTFKDLAGSVVASVLKENKVHAYVTASTGNLGTAYSRYLAGAGITATVFIPDISLKIQEAQIASFGQNVIRVKGDYQAAKVMAADFAKKHGQILTAGNFDPMRIEAKKTMVYEWLRVLPEFPTVFLQAVSGGTGPMGIGKACQELKNEGVFEKMPRMILPQPHRCDPMAKAWEEAHANGFPEGWVEDYQKHIIDNPETTINTLATGNPKAYIALAPIVRESQGHITSVPEEKTLDVTRLLAYKIGVRMGPACATTIVGFFKALRQGHIVDGDVVMINAGEGVGRSPEYVEQMSYSSQYVGHLDETRFIPRENFEQRLWDAVAEI